MRIAFFDTHRFDRAAFEQANASFGQVLTYFEPRLTSQTAGLATGFPAVCSFVNDRLDGPCLRALADGGTRLVALRSAGFNHVDMAAAANLGIRVARVPAYSPHAVAEHAVALILSLNRKIHRANARVREHNFSLDGLVGFDLHGKTVGVIGTGQIGSIFARIMAGFGCRVLAFDRQPNEAVASLPGTVYATLDEIYAEADIISLHVPLTPETRHLIDERALAQMKTGVMLINTGRGRLIDTGALIEALKSGHLGSAGLDVYEEEEKVFFQDLSDEVLQDDLLARLLTFPNVLITSHQAFLTREALVQIARATLANLSAFDKGGVLTNEVSPRQVVLARGA
jgi:D-lactate dehydrogenase